MLSDRTYTAFGSVKANENPRESEVSHIHLENFPTYLRILWKQYGDGFGSRAAAGVQSRAPNQGKLFTSTNTMLNRRMKLIYNIIYLTHFNASIAFLNASLSSRQPLPPGSGRQKLFHSSSIISNISLCSGRFSSTILRS